MISEWEEASCNRSEAAIQWKTQETGFYFSPPPVCEITPRKAVLQSWKTQPFLLGQETNWKDRNVQIVRRMMPSQISGTLPSLQYSRHFCHLLPKHLVPPLLEKEWSKWAWGGSNLAVSTFLRDTMSVHRCQGKGYVALSTSLKHTHLEGFPASRRPGRGGCHPWPTKQQMMCGGNSMETRQPWKIDYSCILYVTVIPGFWSFRIRPSTSPSSARDRKDASLHLFLTVPRSWSVWCARNT